MIIPCIKTCAPFVCIKNYFTSVKVSAAYETFKNCSIIIVSAKPEFTPRKVLENPFHLLLGALRCYLGNPLVCRMRFWNKNTNVNIALDSCSGLKIQQKVHDDFFFASFRTHRKRVLVFCKIIAQRKTNHKVEFCSCPACCLCLAHNIFEMLCINFLVKTQLPEFFRSFNSKGKPAFTYCRKFFKDSQRHTVYFK